MKNEKGAWKHHTNGIERLTLSVQYGPFISLNWVKTIEILIALQQYLRTNLRSTHRQSMGEEQKGAWEGWNAM